MESSSSSSKMSTSPKSEFMLFGVRVVVDSMRKSVSLNNLSQYQLPLDSKQTDDVIAGADVISAAGYASADDAAPRTSSAAANRERRRGVPWTEEEHKLFLLGLQKVGKGDWRGISRNFVKTRTPTQVASHAQKYFLRRSNQNRRRRRSSLFDITTDSVSGNPMISNDNKNIINCESSQSPAVISNVSVVKFTVQPETTRFPANQIYQAAINTKSFDLNENSMIESSPLSLNLSLSMSSDVANMSSSSSSRHSGFQIMQGFSNGDSIISVA